MREIPGYTLGDSLHEGPDVLVFAATHDMTKLPVVVKTARQTDAHSAGTRVILRELDVLSRLAHRGIPKLVESDENPPAFLACTRAPGSTLRALMTECAPPWPNDALAEIGLQLCDILAHVHEQGLAHGDIKPEHVIVAENGELSLVDFGSSRPLNESAPGKYDRGTPAYASPEQSLGDAIDARSDLFSLGRVLEELGAGTLPPGLERFSGRLPADRFATAIDAAMALRPLVSDRSAARDSIVRLTGAGPGSLRGLALASKYDLVRSIGRGSTGTVYEAIERSNGHTRALKVIHRELAGDPAIQGRFAREAAVLSHLKGKHIAALLDWGTVPDPTGASREDLTYLAFEFVRGSSLRERLSKPGGIFQELALTYLREMLEAVGSAHEQGVLHRDLKPENVLVTDDDRVVVVDFGLAKLVRGGTGTTGLTAHNVVFGTPQYMSPEQTRGDEPAPASDLYSLGVMAYELFTGSVPFRHKSALALLAAHTTDTPEPPRTRAPDREIPQAIEQVILRALEKDPAKRFASARDFLAALDPAPADAQTADSTSPSTPWVPDPPNRARKAPESAKPSGRPLSNRREPHIERPSREALVWIALALVSVGLGAWAGFRP